MFKKGLDVLNKTKESVKGQIVELQDEPDNVSNAKVHLKNMKWSLKLLIEHLRAYYMASDKQVQQTGGLATIFNRFGDKTSHTNYTENSTVPLSVALKEVGEGVKDSAVLFQQYTILFADRLINQITSLYEGPVKKAINQEKAQEEIRNKYNVAISNLKGAQKSGKNVAEKQSEFDQAKAIYDSASNNLVQLIQETVESVQRDVAIAMKQFVADQKRLAEEGVRMWTAAESKIFNVESPTSVPQQSFSNEPVNISKLSLNETSPQQHQQQQPPVVGTTSPQPTTTTTTNVSSPSENQENPFDVM